MLVKHISHRRKTTAKKCLGQHNVLGWCFLWLNIYIYWWWELAVHVSNGTRRVFYIYNKVATFREC